MKRLILSMAMFFSLNASAQVQNLPGTYGIHLFFNETEFVDELIFTEDESGVLQGHMVVPNDFEGDVYDLVVKDKEVSFKLLVPKNSARPVDLVFEYTAILFDESARQMIGYVTLENETGFVASFVGFKR